MLCSNMQQLRKSLAAPMQRQRDTSPGHRSVHLGEGESRDPTVSVQVQAG